MRYAILVESATAEKILEVNRRTQQKTFPIMNKEGRYLGYITIDDVSKYKEQPEITAGEILYIVSADATRTTHAHINDSPESVIKKIENYNIEFVPVVDDEENLIGTADKSSLLRILSV